VETEHRLVFPFSDHGVPCDTLADAAELTFAARATSSFPGAFPPFTVGELDKVLKKRDQDWGSRDEFLATMLPRQAAANAAENAVLIDGSVLANAPFRPAIEALRERPARRQIDRRFVYIDPSPGMKIKLGKTAAGPPSFFQTLIGALSELPRQQPIRDNLEAIVSRSERIERMRTVIGNIRPEVDAQIEALFGRTLFLDRPTPARLAAWRIRAQNGAADGAGYAYGAYGHLKIHGVIELTTDMLHHIGGEPGTEQWHRLRTEICAAIEARNVDQLGTSFSRGVSKETVTFLRSHDIGFRIRRLRLLARRLVEVETGAERQSDFAAMRDAIYQALSLYLEAKRTDNHAKLRPLVRKSHGDAGPLLDALAESMDLKKLDDATDDLLATALSGLHKNQRRPLLLDYLGFPYFDVATLPLLQGEGLDEFDAIKVDRISPDDARSIREGGAEATLKGIQFNSFGAFFSRAYRENDYLWGRLHGADRLIDIVVSTLPNTKTLKLGRVAKIKHAAFLAILDEEEPRLTSIAPLFAALRIEIG
jgi:patatin-related protein